MSHAPTTIALGRPAPRRWFDEARDAVRALLAQWRDARRLAARERALRGLDRRVLRDLGLPEPDCRAWESASLAAYEVVRW
jgi:hypothetical protein